MIKIQIFQAFYFSKCKGPILPFPLRMQQQQNALLHPAGAGGGAVALMAQNTIGVTMVVCFVDGAVT